MKKRIIRVGVALLLFAILGVIELTVEVPLYISLPLHIAVYLFVGYEVAYKALRGLVRGLVTDENLLMFIATVGAFIIGEYLEAIAVMLFYQVGEIFQDLAVGKSRRSIVQLMMIKPEKATVIVDGEEKEIAPEEVKVGEIILVRVGEKIAVDGVLVEGESLIDQSMLTGESVPKSVKTGESVLSGSVNLCGVIKVRATSEYGESTVAKILDLVENATAKKAKTEKFISRFATVYTPIVTVLALIVAIVPSLITGDWSLWVYRALTFLVVSCPCALVISVPLAFFGAIGGASRLGALIKGGNFVEALSKVSVLLTDKTGTLTKGKFVVKRVFPQENREEILRLASIAESKSLHPIAKCIVSEYGENITDEYERSEIAGKGVIAKNKSEEIIAGSYSLMKEKGVILEDYDCDETTVFVAKNGKLSGYIEVGDEIKDEAITAVTLLKKQGVKTVMLTGDSERVAKSVASALGIDEYHYSLLPNDKVCIAEEYLRQGKTVAFCGDGINDAPVLTRVSVGVSMGAIGSDSAIEASDIVLMQDNLLALVKAKTLAKKAVKIVKQNIAFSLAVKIAVMIMSAFGILGMWWAILADVGVMCLAVLNSLRTLKKVK